jgi:hypothetical protein
LRPRRHQARLPPGYAVPRHKLCRVPSHRAE